MTLTLREAGPGDIGAITRIYAEAVLNGTATFETEPPSEAEMGRRHAELLAAGLPWLVAARGALVVGYAYAGLYRTRAAYRSTLETSVYVAPEARGQGVGRALLGALIPACAALDARRLVAVIAHPGSDASVALHAGAGFVPAGSLPGVGYKHGRWLDTLLMQRALGPGLDRPPTRI
ncbi:GNAT family N-acetyltransferase [Methylobacterium radiodurans]|uniref:GNAT family N-acetyltransferase n=1 Tax=Methylobacterium radiodurans TaxID=2202828 RepID=A0A2U8VVY0_9HYPH|nr:GNAT family N-acetyltransferase [Methylobacterium radiodurans]AWN37989.1 GNAT family N-acetyltransferase [Methylobacterium radiodurans]